MTITEVLEHITKVCIRNEDGSLTLGTFEVELLEKTLEAVQQVTVRVNKLSKLLK